MRSRSPLTFIARAVVLVGIGATSLLIAAPANANPATLDTTCSGNGYTEDAGGGVDIVTAVARDSAGRLVAAGTSDGQGSDDFVVLRYNPNCTLDTTFAPNSPLTPGVAFIDVSGRGAQDAAADVAVQPDGKIVVAGYRESALTDDIAVIRLNTNGSLDDTFDGDGISVIASGAAERGTALTLQPDGKIVVAGKTNEPGNDDALLVRLNKNGSLDETFDGDGLRRYTLGANAEQLEDVAVRPDGRIVAGGWATTATADDLAFISVKPNGTPDSTFDTDGLLLINGSGSSDERVNGIAIRPNGNIVSGGYTNAGGTYDFLAQEIDATGATVGTGIYDLTGGDDRGQSIALQPDGKAIIAGAAGSDTGIARTAGAVSTADTSFDTDGLLTINTGGTSTANDILVQPDGRIVFGGYSTAAAVFPNFFLARLQGSPLVRFGVAAATLNENAGSVTVTVQRLGATQDAVTVHYATANGSATAPADYGTRSGTLSFGAGVAAATFTVPIVNDTAKEAAESFTVTLSAPGGGAALGSPATTTITIRASDQQPDEHVKISGGSYVGNNVYNTTGASQTVQVSAARGTKKVFYVNVTNDGNVINAFKVRGAGSSSGFTVAYFSGTTATNITSSILAGTFSTSSLAPGAGKLIRVEITVSSGAAHGAVKSVPITATWSGDGYRYDVVKANVKVL